MSDFGVRGTARVVVGVSGSPGSLTALRRAAEEARCRGGELWAALAWEPPNGEYGARRSPLLPLLVERCERLAEEELLGILGDLFGTGGPGVPLHALIARGRAGRALMEIADRETDLLVIGAGRRSRLHRALSSSVSRYCLAHATCPVLVVPPSPLEAAFTAAHRRNRWHLRMDTRHLAEDAKSVPPVPPDA